MCAEKKCIQDSFKFKKAQVGITKELFSENDGEVAWDELHLQLDWLWITSWDLVGTTS